MKQMRGRLREQGILLYLAAFSMIVILIIAVMGGYLYRFYYRTIYNAYLSANEADLKSVSDRHENDMDVIQNVVSQIGLSTDSTEFLLRDQPMKSRKLEDQLYRYTAVSQFFGQVLYFYHGDQYLYNHKTSVSINNFLQNGLILKDTDTEVLRELLYREDYRMIVLPEQGVTGYLRKMYMNAPERLTVYLCTISPKNTATAIFLVAGSYYDSLLTGTENDRNHYIVYQDQIVTKRESEPVDSAELLQVLSDAGISDSTFSDDTELQKTVKIGGKSWLTTARKGDSGLVYVGLQPMTVFFSQVKSGMWGIILLLLFCSIPAAAGIVVLYRKIAGRIRKINTMLKKEDSPYDFGTIENGIETLVKDNETLAKDRETHAPLRKSRFIGNLIRGVYRSEEEIVNAAAEAKIVIPADGWCLTVMIGELGGDRGQNNEEKAEKEMLELIQAMPDIDGYRIKLISKTRNVFVLFGTEKDKAETLLHQLYEAGNVACEEFVMAVSDYHENLMEVPQAYLEADTAFDTRFIVDNSEMIRYQKASGVEHIEILPESFLRRLKNAIRACNQSAADEVIEEICGKLKSGSHSLLSFRVLYNDILHLLITEWNDTHVDFTDVYNVFLLSQCLTVQQFSDILHEVCRRLIDARETSGQEGQQESDMAARAVAYMKEHYSSPDLTMAALAQELEISPVTMSVAFKNRMGVNPSDYLGIIRMEKAKELLKNSDMKIKDVSAAVGYEDDHVFLRRFKKYVGKTPGQYREEQRV